MSQSEGPVFLFKGDDVEVAWDERLCIHVGECTRAEEGCFGGDKKPWGRPDDADVRAVEEIVTRCPSGALTYLSHDGSEETAPAENTAFITSRGPIYLTGQLSIDGASEDMPGVAFRAALCRCGASKNKPFCDNSHVKIGFDDQGAIGSRGPGMEDDGGELNVGRAPNGPLLVSGNLTIVSGSGRAAWRGSKAALCRCGASKNKPFCDGNHKAAGFEAD